jgi:ribonuclease HI
MDIAWKQIETSSLMLKYSACMEMFLSASKAETVAVFTVLLTTPSFCEVNIYSDNATVVNMLNALNSLPSCNSNLYKIHDSVYWIAILQLISLKNLHITAIKVTAHLNNKWNNYVDSLAINAYIEPKFYLNSRYIDAYLLKWNNIVMEQNVRSTLKDLINLKWFSKFLTKHRNKKWYLNPHLVNWTLTFENLAYCETNSEKALLESQFRSFKFKCFNQDLPTISQLKRR